MDKSFPRRSGEGGAHRATDEGCYLGENQMINFCAPKNDRKIYIMCAIISSLTEFKDSSRADIQPSSVSKLTPSPNLRGKDLQHSPSTICLCIKFRFGSCADVWDVEGAIPYHKTPTINPNFQALDNPV